MLINREISSLELRLLISLFLYPCSSLSCALVRRICLREMGISTSFLRFG
ncbi:hypothetical protein SLEP1_g47044 [Rubroshorea leprosula]|uniref:Uncharacterized protein n=1 Tax=Rubroshorea leprosula TaxID=152421 RepID=A0AAV5LQ21_9ROSI|nr:hypothetical protein SLEP1_g47044 [Rubroshorea leprosula]